MIVTNRKFQPNFKVIDYFKQQRFINNLAIIVFLCVKFEQP